MLTLRSILIERRAGRMRDPVTRLRYLRSAVAPARRTSRLKPNLLFVPAGLAIVAAAVWAAIRPAEPMKTAPPARPALSRSESAPQPWLVELRDREEIWSNGLRIDFGRRVRAGRRRYLLHDLEGGRSTLADRPAGILFHSTEGDLVPLEPARNPELRAAAQSLAGYVENRLAYHYLIDRVGRVRRIVEEDSPAHHAGNAVWAGRGHAVLNLNHAFLAVAFEGRTGAPLSRSQTDAGRLLIEVLRSRYKIPAENCLTHAQVSVNPGNMLIGWHTDLGEGLPWAALGLPDNYQWPPAALAELGFGWDAHYLERAAEGLWSGVHRAGAGLRARAAEAGMSPERWATTRRELYRNLRRKEHSNL